MLGTRRTSLLYAVAPWLLCLVGAAGGCTANAETQPAPSPKTTELLPAIRVTVVTAEIRTLDLDASASGKLHAFKTATVAAEVPGKVTLRSVERGAEVGRRDTLFRIDTRNSQLSLQQAQANQAASAIDLGLANRELDRGEALLAGDDIAASHYDQLTHSRDSAKKRAELAEISRKVAAKSVADARVRAPFGATVVRLHAEVGDYVGPGAPLATVADLSKMRLRVGVTAAEADGLESRDSTAASVSFPALGGVTLEASLHDIDPLMDPTSGTYTAEFWIEQTEDAALREGMVGRVQLDTASDEADIVIPRGSVVREGAGFAVWVVERAADHRGKARRQSVRLGRNDATHTVVLGGLAQGDTIVIDGHFALAEGATVELDEARA